MKCQKWTDQPDTSVEQRKKIWVPNRGSTLVRFLSGTHIFLLCSTLVSCWSVHFSHFITELKIYYLYSFTTLTMTSTVLILVVYAGRLSHKWPCSPWVLVLVSQWIECPPSVREVMGSTSVGNSCHVDQFTFHTFKDFVTWKKVV